VYSICKNLSLERSKLKGEDYLEDLDADEKWY